MSGKFRHYSICGCEVKDFWIDSASMKWPFLGFFGPLLSQILLNLAGILTRGKSPIRQTQCLKNPSKF